MNIFLRTIFRPAMLLVYGASVLILVAAYSSLGGSDAVLEEPQVLERMPYPQPLQNLSGLTLSALAAESLFVGEDGRERVLFEKNSRQEFPIASITKLVTALTAEEYFAQNDMVTITEEAIRGKGVSGMYTVGQQFFFHDALQALLIASHNEIAESLAAPAGPGVFVESMNRKAAELGLFGTHFVNATGLDPLPESEELNRSSASDLVRLLRYLAKTRPQLLALTANASTTLAEADGNAVVVIISTDKLLLRDDLPFTILGGKTGETPRAGKNLALVTRAPRGGFLFNVVLGSQDHFADMQALLHYADSSFAW